ELLDRLLLGRRIGQREAAIELVDEAEIPDEVPQEADFSLVQVRQIYARAEQPASCVLRVRDGAAAQDADFGLRIEQCQVDRDFRAGERRFVLGVEELRVVQCEHRNL